MSFPTIHNITFDCTGDPYDLGLFWSALFGRPLADEDKPGDPEAVIKDPDGGPTLLFIRVPEGKTVKNRIHLDLRPHGRTRAEEVERVALGARVRGPQPAGRRRVGPHGGPRGQRVLCGTRGAGLTFSNPQLGSFPGFPVAAERVGLHRPGADRHRVAEDVGVLLLVAALARVGVHFDGARAGSTIM